MDQDEPVFNRRAVRPIQCLIEGWQLVKDDYWLFLGITLLGLLIGTLTPMGLLLGPAMCGIHICLLRRSHDQSVSFDMLFKGFDYFVQGLIATLLMMAPMVLLLFGSYVLFAIGTFGMLAAIGPRPRGAPPDPGSFWLFFLPMMALILFVTLIAMLIRAMFLFSYPLIVDRELSGYEAVHLSLKAFFGNFWGMVGFILLNELLVTIGLLACYVGAIFVLPITMAMVTVAYHQVFPDDFRIRRPRELDEDELEPAGPIRVADTGIQE